MSMETFKQALKIISSDNYIAIGGGEPTLHPDLIEMLSLASFLQEEPIFFVTNGTCKRNIWKDLLRAHKTKRICLNVSNTPWHKATLRKPWVEQDAQKYQLWWGETSYLGLRIIPDGRASKNKTRLAAQGGKGFSDLSRGSEPEVWPNGDIYSSVIGKGPVGTIWDKDALEKAFKELEEGEG